MEGRKRVLGHPADVVAVGEGGMLGMAIDPAFAANRSIYVCFLSSIPGGVGDVRVVRFTVDPTYSSLGARADILTGFR